MSLDFAFRFLRYYLTAQSKHAIHSPFVYSLVTNVILPDRNDVQFSRIENIRRHLLRNRKSIVKEDYGAGRKVSNLKEETIASIVAGSSKQARYCRLLYRLVNYFQPNHILELGTSVGISTMYLALANPNASIITMEGSRTIAELAEYNFKILNLQNINVVKGTFEEQLAGVLQSINVVDFIYIDGNHSLRPTLAYFEQILEKSHKNTIFVIDDINWSAEMQKAWSIIKNHTKVHVTVDLFMMGLVFLNPDLSKEHFIIRY